MRVCVCCISETLCAAVCMCAYLDAGGKTAGLLFREKMSQDGLSRTKHRVPALERWENTDIKTTVCAECAFVCFCVSLK